MDVLILDSTLKTVKGVLTETPSVQPTFVTNYADATSTGFTEGSSDGAFNSTTPVTLTSAPAASTRRIVREISVYNGDTNIVTLTLYLDNNGTQRTIRKVKIKSGETYFLSSNTTTASLGENSFQIDSSTSTDGLFGVLNGAINGSNTLFTVSSGKYISGSLNVFLNGQLLIPGSGNDWTETSPSTGTFTMLSVPVIGDILTVNYQVSFSASGNADTLDGFHSYQFANSNGWTSLGGNPTFVSADGATGVMNIDSDISSFISKGMRISYQQSQSLTAYWTFNTNSTPDVGSFTMGNIGTPSYTSGKFGNALTLNGSSALNITDNANLKPTGDFTIAMWFKTSTTGVTQRLFQSYSSNTNLAGVATQIFSTNVLRMAIGKNSGTTEGIDYSTLTGTTVVTDGNWHHGVFTLKGNYAQIYLDGNLDAYGYIVSPPVYAATNYIRIGCVNTSGTDSLFFTGQIEDLYVINGYSLDEQTVRSLFLSNSGVGTTALLLTKYGIVTAVGVYSGGVIPLTIWGGTDFSLVSGTISNLKYSSVKVPFGFNINPDKWTVFVADIISKTKTSPVANTWYSTMDAGTLPSIDVPIGLWNVQYKGAFRAATPSTTGGVFANLKTTLSKINGSETDLDLTLGSTSQAYVSATFVALLLTSQSFPKLVNLTSKTTFYLLITSSGTMDTLMVQGATSTTIIKAVCAYL